MRERIDRALDGLSARLIAAGGSLGALTALATSALLCALCARWFEALRPASWALFAALAYGAGEAAARGRLRGPGARALRAATPPVALVLTSVWMLWPIWAARERAFLDQDNATHVERARVFWEAVSHGRWPYWTNVLMGGEPLADAYGWLGNLLPPLFRAVTFGRIDFALAYVWTLCSLHALSGVAVYALARRFSRRAVAFTVGLLFLVGGHLVPYLTGDRPLWHLHLHMGLWHSFLSALLAMFATAKLVDVVRRGRLGDAVALSLLVTAACLSHGFGTLAVVTLLGCTTAAGLLSPPPSSRRTWLGVYALACGLLVSAAWTYPASRVLAEWGLRFPRPPHEDDQSLLEFVGPLSTATLLAGGVASFAGLFHRDRLLRGVAAAGLSTILLDEAGVVSQLGLADSPAGRAMQWHRLTLLFVLASTAPLAAMIDRTIDRRPRAPLSVRTVGARAIGAFVAFVFVLPPLVVTMGRGRHALKTVEVTKVEDPAVFSDLEAALRRLRAQDPGAYRVYFGARPNAFAAMALALRTGVPITALFHPPGQFLKNRPQTADPDELRAWGNKYLIYDAGLHVQPYWKELERIGPYKLYRDEQFSGLVRAPAPVGIDVLEFSDDAIRFRVRGAPAGGVDVQIGVANYPRWRAFQHDRRLAIEAAPARAHGPADQVRLHVVDGEVTLTPQGRLPASRIGWAATDVGCALFGLLIALRASPRLRARGGELLVLARERARQLRASGRGPTPTLPSRRAMTLAAGVLLVAAFFSSLPRRGAGRPSAFFGDREAVRRNDIPCRQRLNTRRWVCGEPFAQPAAEVLHAVANEPTPSQWLQGDSWSALRVVEHEGASTIRVRFPNVRVSRAVHLRMAPVGALPFSAHVRVLAPGAPGDGPGKLAPLRHGWATVPTDVDGLADVEVELAFTSRGGLDLAVTSDGSTETPKLPNQ